MHDGGSSREDVAARLEMLRLWAGHDSQTAFAIATGLSASEWNHFESGRRPLAITAAHKLRLRWRVTLDWLYYGDRSGLTVEMANSLPTLDQKRQA